VAPEIAVILDGLTLEADGIYSAPLPVLEQQADEFRERAAVGGRDYPDLLLEISRHHSIPVMDREVREFLRGIPVGGLVADVGGGWGWHWRNLGTWRPDVGVLVVDFVRQNLRQAARLLGGLVNNQVFLVHGDATALPFPPSAFDGYWTVQTLQHVPRFEQAIEEAHRVLRPNAQFACYSLNRAKLVEITYRLLGRPYHVRGSHAGGFYLARTSDDQRTVIERVFGSVVRNRYTEILFQPDLRLRPGGEASRIAAIDARLSSSMPLFAWIARQRSYHTRKPS
jgi:ubiquinone/menaquinone biosynthesis C-methylase UbiE